MRKIREETLKFDKIVPGGQVLGTAESGKKIFAWGVLPGETAKVRLAKSKKTHAEGFAVEILESSPERILPKDEGSFLSTSPWQIMNFSYEQKLKDEIIREAFSQNNIALPKHEEIYSDGRIFDYRNKVEFSFWWEKYDEEDGELNLSFFRRGGHGKIPVSGTSLANPEINLAANRILGILRQRKTSSADLKTLLIRSSANDEIYAQLYVKNPDFTNFTDEEFGKMKIAGFELIFSNPKSPASVITKRLQSFGQKNLEDEILGINFKYATESFFQINIPVYEKVLLEIKKFIDDKKPTIDLYSGVGSIGLTVSENNLTMVEINEFAVNEMRENIKKLGRENSAKAILSASENMLDVITKDTNLILDPPRAGLNKKVCQKILETEPEKIIYLSCNPITQARDAAILGEKYKITFTRGYNFFPRTPHIENLIIFEKK